MFYCRQTLTNYRLQISSIKLGILELQTGHEVYHFLSHPKADNMVDEKSNLIKKYGKIEKVAEKIDKGQGDSYNFNN